MNLGAGRCLDYIVLKSIAQSRLIDDQPDKDEEAKVLDPGLLDRLQYRQLHSDALRGRHSH